MFGGEGRKSGPDIWGNPFYHQYSCVINSQGITCGGQDREGGFLGSRGAPSQDTYEPKQCDEVKDSTLCFEQCLLDAWKESRPWYGFPSGVDCKDYDNDLHDRCRKQCKI